MPRKINAEKSDHRASHRATESPAPRPKPKIDFTEDALDFKNTNLLRQFVTDQGRILPRKYTGLPAHYQRRLTTAIKRARQMLLLPPVLKKHEWEDQATGRIDAQKLAEYLGVSLKRLAEGLALNYKVLHRNPAGESFQTPLNSVKRCLEILQVFFGKPETVRVWLNTPHPDLNGCTALEIILANNAIAVLRILENSAAGVPV